MNRRNTTLLLCTTFAALAMPRAAWAGEAQEDPRAQVMTGFGPLAHPAPARPTLLPEVEQPTVEVPWTVGVAGAGIGFVAGGMAGFAIVNSRLDCRGTSSELQSFACLVGAMGAGTVGLGTGMAGALLGGVAATVIYRASHAPVQVTPVVGKGTQGVAISGTF